MEPSLERLRQACAVPLDHPDAAAMKAAGAQAIAYLIDEFSALPQRDLGQTALPAQLAALLVEPWPETGIGLDAAMLRLREQIVPYAVPPGHPRFLAFVPGAPCFPAMLGAWLCDGLNLFAGVWKEGAGPAQVELVVLDWFRQLLGLPSATAGILTSGGSEAILTALVVARAPLSCEQRARAVLYASDQRHGAVDRAARIIGLRPDQLRILATAHDGRLSAEVLRQAVVDDARAGRLPWLLVATAGTTNTGAIDPLDELAAGCAEQRLWLHVDAAYGWAAALTDAGRTMLHGIEHADSVSLDPHKWFAQPYDVGCLLVRRGAALTESFALRPEYLQDVEPAPDEVNFADRGIALTRRFRALQLWLSIQTLGMDWFRRLVAHSLYLADYAERLLAEHVDFELLARRELSVVCFRYAPPGWSGWSGSLDELNRRLCVAAVRTGQVFLATTRVHGVIAQRICFVNWRTTASDVEAVVHLLATLGHGLRAPA